MTCYSDHEWYHFKTNLQPSNNTIERNVSKIGWVQFEHIKLHYKINMTLGPASTGLIQKQLFSILIEGIVSV